MMNDLTKILVPIANDETSPHVLEQAYALADRYGADVELLHTWLVPLTPHAYPRSMPAPMAGNHFETAAKRHVAALLDERPPPEGVSVTPIVERGAPSDAILNHAEDADLIVMATHGRTGLERVLMGSTTEEVVRRAPCPVLTFRAEALPN